MEVGGGVSDQTTGVGRENSPSLQQQPQREQQQLKLEREVENGRDKGRYK